MDEAHKMSAYSSDRETLAYKLGKALVTFPHPETGEVKSLFTRRVVKTPKFEINDDELEFYDALTRYVQDPSIRAAGSDSPQVRAVGFTMAMLQRRFASSIYAARRSLERMKERREKILADPAAYRQEQIDRRVPEGFEDLEDDEKQAIIRHPLESRPVGATHGRIHRYGQEKDCLLRIERPRRF